MKITATCPTCGAELELEDLAPGTAVECPACNHALTVPEPPRARVRIAARRPSAPSPSPVDVRVRGTVTTQRTSKKWKVMRLVGLLLLGGGIVYGIGHQEDGDAAGVALAIALPGVLLMLVARIGRWWTND